MTAFMGIADCYGLESFIPQSAAQPTFLKLRADANRHRHAIVYQAELTDKQVQKISSLITKSEHAKALAYLKATGNMKTMQQYQHSAQIIPNPALDPYGSDECGNCQGENAKTGYVKSWDGKCPDCGREVQQ